MAMSRTGDATQQIRRFCGLVVRVHATVPEVLGSIPDLS
jgi:hypothetical protein